MRYASVCDGIGAAHVAFQPLGWTCAWRSEIEPFPKAVVAARWPNLGPDLGDMTKITDEELAAHGPIDILVGGTPCQSFSVAGLRKGLADPRGNLTLAFLALVRRTGAQWVLWENVPGVLSAVSHDAPDCGPPGDGVEADPRLCDRAADEGRLGEAVVVTDEYEADESHAFACFLAGLRELGYGYAYATLDAQFFNLAQRRERVFVVARLGDWRAPAAVLLDAESLSGNPPPSREAGQDAAGTPAARSTAGGGLGTDFDLAGGLQVARSLNAYAGRIDGESETFVAAVAGHGSYREGLGSLRAQGGDVAGGSEMLVAHSLRADGFDASEDGTGRGTPLVVWPLQEVGKRESKDQNGVGIGLGDGTDPMFTLQAGAQHGVAYSIRSDAKREGTALTPSPDAEGRVRLRDPGLGITEELAPTIDAARPHSVAVTAPCLRSNAYNNSDPAMEAQMLVPFDDPGVWCQDCDKRHDPPACCKIPGCDCGGARRITEPVAFDTYNQSISPKTQSLRDPNGTFGDALPAVFIPDTADPICANEQRTFDNAGNNAGKPHNLIAFDTTQMTSALNRSQPNEGDPCHPLAAGAHPLAVAFTQKDHGQDCGEDVAPTLRAMGHDGSHANGGGQVAVAFTQDGRQQPRLQGGDGQRIGALNANAGAGRGQSIAVASMVRRLTPVECARLQGFPDTYLDIEYRGKPAADGPKYRALGNSWAVPVVAWIARRIDILDTALRAQ